MSGWTNIGLDKCQVGKKSGLKVEMRTSVRGGTTAARHPHAKIQPQESPESPVSKAGDPAPTQTSNGGTTATRHPPTPPTKAQDRTQPQPKGNTHRISNKKGTHESTTHTKTYTTPVPWPHTARSGFLPDYNYVIGMVWFIVCRDCKMTLLYGIIVIFTFFKPVIALKYS